MAVLLRVRTIIWAASVLILFTALAGVTYTLLSYRSAMREERKILYQMAAEMIEAQKAEAQLELDRCQTLRQLEKDSFNTSMVNLWGRLSELEKQMNAHCTDNVKIHAK